MGPLLFRVLSADKIIIERWRKAFSTAGWAMAAAGDAGALKDKPAPCELALIELGTELCAGVKDFGRLVSAWHPLSAIAFGDPGSTPNSRIAAVLEAGADDFFFKNLDERILVAKIKAHLRRLAPAINVAAARCSSRNGEIRIDSARRAVTLRTRAGKSAELANLTQRELDILALLVRNEASVVSRESILEEIWREQAAEVYSECIDKHVESLRKKLGAHGAKIRTVYGAGYMFSTEQQKNR